jgi:NAD+ kinase
MTTIGILARPDLTGAAPVLKVLVDWLDERGAAVCLEANTAAALGEDSARGRTVVPGEAIAEMVDALVVLGGDGTLLAASRLLERKSVPVLGVNFGSLGFLTEIRIDELMPSLERVLDGTAVFDERAMLEADAYRKGQQVDSRIVLNDVVFTKAALSRMIELSVSVDGGFVTRVKADGLIIASATGSTAYNLAAGGPIVHPMVNALVMTPIAPHTLTNRPVVIPGGAGIEVEAHGSSSPDEIFVTYDGQSGYPLHESDVVKVRMSARILRLVKAPARSYFELLREKLKWGER